MIDENKILTESEALDLYLNAPLQELTAAAHRLRMQKIPRQEVSWQIDRNVNICNVCISGCKFCTFHCGLQSPLAFTTSIDEYKQKIEELFAQGGNQLLLQGGLHPHYGIEFYEDLLRTLKHNYPTLKLHALGPPEIAHIATLSHLTHRKVLQRLMAAGLDSLPGAGAEILVERVRQQLSPRKPSVQAWCDVMHEAHLLHLTTSATMMFGHIETPRERIQHLLLIRELQNAKPNNSNGFTAFIPWTAQLEHTRHLPIFKNVQAVSDAEYIRTIAISRLVLHNISHIQASWLTVGTAVAQQCLHAGADDLGSIMIEENVLSSAGSHRQLDAAAMQAVISNAGFTPWQRNQKYEAEGR
ncbi:cyclic dehypoxanthine futalosine synthase [Bacteroidia bacterium]|nr:cyclic dehypoxanthine futalosine synthase [Bacteroidia bacterium]